MNEEEILRFLIGEFRDKLSLVKDLVTRDSKFPDAPNKIKIVIGMRRVGKTYFLYQQILQMISNGYDINRILYINFEDDRLLPLNEQKLAALVDAFYSMNPENHDHKCFLFFDEIQNVENWPLVIRRLHDSKNVEIFLTGSSAKLLSREIATSLRGRSLAIEINPYSFEEYIRAKKIPIDRSLYDKKKQDQLKHIFLQYLSEGGFPEVTSTDEDVRHKILQEYVDIVIYRDIIERHDIKNAKLIKYLILSMIHNVSKPFSINKFYNDIRSQGYKIGKDVLYEYIEHIEDTFLAFSIPLYDKSIRKVHVNPKKIYAIDAGMMRALTLDFENDLGKLFENIVFLDLKRLGYDVKYYLTEERYEVDFVAQTPRGHKKLFQVAWDVSSKETLEREERALQAGMKELKIEGEIITLDSYLRNGVKIP